VDGGVVWGGESNDAEVDAGIELSNNDRVSSLIVATEGDDYSMRFRIGGNF
jgi:hypothetical protein